MTNEERIKELAFVLQQLAHDVRQVRTIAEIINDINAERAAKEPVKCPFCYAEMELQVRPFNPRFRMCCSKCGLSGPYCGATDDAKDVLRRLRMET